MWLSQTMPIPKKRGEQGAAKQAAYEQKIASLRDAYLNRAASPPKKRTSQTKNGWKRIRDSVPKLVEGLPRCSIAELLAMYRKCTKKMAGHRPAEISPLVLVLHKAILNEWDRRLALLSSAEGYFQWPSTDAPLGDGGLPAIAWRSVGMLSALGYHVGTTEGIPEDERRFILDQLFQIALPPLNDMAYMIEWGTAQTAVRLKKLAETIAALTRNAKRRRSRDLQVACEEWEADLEYLYTTCYIGRFRFVWPAIEILSA
jgi:hypothetical protein